MIRYDVIHPHKNTILRNLVSVLDDPKKLVRVEAVETRSKWCEDNLLGFHVLANFAFFI